MCAPRRAAGRKNTTTPARVTARPRRRVRFKEIAAISANIALVCLVAVVAFGFFYTLMPEYRKTLLADRVARQQEMLADLKEKQREVADKMRENAVVLAEQEHTIAKNKEDITALHGEIASLARQNAKIFAENATALREKEKIAMDVAFLRDESAAARVKLLAVEANLENAYRDIFRESMEDYTIEQFFALYGGKPRSDKAAKPTIDIVVEYKEKTLPAASLIEKSLSGHGRKISKSYTMIPPAIRKKLADEGRNSLSKREDLKSVPFDFAKVVALLNERDNRILALSTNLPQAERIKLANRISAECNKKLATLVAEFKHAYIKQVRTFFEDNGGAASQSKG